MRSAPLLVALALAAAGCASPAHGPGSPRPERHWRPVHGTSLVRVVALPGAQPLSHSGENVVTAATDLGFAVTVSASGTEPARDVKVTLTIHQAPSPIVQTRRIERIDPGTPKAVTFTDLGQVQFATRVRLDVDVRPVPGELFSANNSGSFPVVFSLG